MLFLKCCGADPTKLGLPSIQIATGPTSTVYPHIAPQQSGAFFLEGKQTVGELPTLKNHRRLFRHVCLGLRPRMDFSDASTDKQIIAQMQTVAIVRVLALSRCKGARPFNTWSDNSVVHPFF